MGWKGGGGGWGGRGVGKSTATGHPLHNAQHSNPHSYYLVHFAQLSADLQVSASAQSPPERPDVAQKVGPLSALPHGSQVHDGNVGQEAGVRTGAGVHGVGVLCVVRGRLA